MAFRVVFGVTIATVLLSKTVSESTSSYNSTRQPNNMSVFQLDKKQAFDFLRYSRPRRDLVEECWEGCYYSEVKDHLRWSDESKEYMLRVRCRSLRCPYGYKCTWASHYFTFYHIRDIYIQCKRV